MYEHLKPEILRRLSNGETLRQICKSPGFPTNSAIVQWCAKDAEFAKQYARARHEGLEVLSDELLAIADDSSEDWVTRIREDGSEYTAIDHDHVNRSRLRVDTRKWLLSKLRPDKYGDRVTQTIEGGAVPLEIKVTRVEK